MHIAALVGVTELREKAKRILAHAKWQLFFTLLIVISKNALIRRNKIQTETADLHIVFLAHKPFAVDLTGGFTVAHSISRLQFQRRKNHGRFLGKNGIRQTFVDALKQRVKQNRQGFAGIQLIVACANENQVFVRQTYGILAAHAIAAKSVMLCHPELVSIPETVIMDAVFQIVVGLLGGGFAYIAGAYQLFSIPAALLHNQLSKAHKIARGTYKRGIAPRRTVRRFKDFGVFKTADVTEKSAVQILQQLHAAQPLHQHAQHIGARAVVVEQGTGRFIRLLRKIPRGSVRYFGCEPVAPGKAGTHHQHIADGLFFQFLGKRFGQFVREIADDGIIQMQLAFIGKGADGKRNKALGNRVHAMRRVFIKRIPIAFKKAFSVS